MPRTLPRQSQTFFFSSEKKNQLWLYSVSFMERQKEPGCQKGWHHRQHTCGQSDVILELQVTIATAWILPAPQIQFVPRISFPHRLSLCPMSPIFSNDTPRFPATQGQNLFVITHIPHVAKSSCSFFVVSLEFMSSSPSSPTVFWSLHPHPDP